MRITIEDAEPGEIAESITEIVSALLESDGVDAAVYLTDSEPMEKALAEDSPAHDFQHQYLADLHRAALSRYAAALADAVSLVEDALA